MKQHQGSPVRHTEKSRQIKHRSADRDVEQFGELRRGNQGLDLLFFFEVRNLEFGGDQVEDGNDFEVGMLDLLADNGGKVGVMQGQRTVLKITDPLDHE